MKTFLYNYFICYGLNEVQDNSPGGKELGEKNMLYHKINHDNDI